MTHDEWIESLSKYINIAEQHAPATAKIVSALRAVVDLCNQHKNDIDVSGFAEEIMEAIQKELG